jgi:DNA end-binding protein Ku
VVLEDSDFENVPLKTVRSIDIELFVDAAPDAQTTLFVKQAYYLEPEAIGRKAFYLLKSVLADENLSAIAKIVLKDREALAAINPYEKTMLLTTLYWPDEIRAVGELDLPEEDFDFKPAEKQMAQQLVQAMKGEFKPENYKDEYREALVAALEAKVAGKPVEVPKPAEAPTKIADLMSVLEASVAAARESRQAGGGAKSGTKAAAKSAVKATAAKATTRKTADKPAEERRRKTA